MHDTENLLKAAENGDKNALNELMEAHRGRLRNMLAVRLDRRLAARIDPSDVVQETLMKAHNRFDEYLRNRPIAFYPWLRQLAWERLADLHNRHVRTAKRSVDREIPMPEATHVSLAKFVVQSATGPQTKLIQEEAIARVREGLRKLEYIDREVLVLRFLEELSLAETAAVLNLSEPATSMRQLRAIARLRRLLGEE